MRKLFLLLFLFTSFLFAQYEKGGSEHRRVGVHNGNQVRTTFTNYGVIGQPGSQGPNCAWKYDANGYATDIQPLVAVRLPYRDYRVHGVYDGVPDTLYSVIGCNADRSGTLDYDPGGANFWGFEPLPDYCNENLEGIGLGVAMSHLPQTWPTAWPDHLDWVDDQGNPEWNGYFGRGQFNADQESYFVMDDHSDDKMFVYHGFLPDSLDPTRRGQGIRVETRGMQWSNFLAQDVLFWVYDITNIGTTPYYQASFGTLVGTYLGVGPMGGTEWMDDASFFNVRESIVYTWDYDHYINPSANPKWLPDPGKVGYIGYAFLESPGNPYDGIDNDGDAVGDAPLFSEQDFAPRTVQAGDQLVLIDELTYERSLFTMPNTSVTVSSMGVDFYLVPDSTVLEEGNMRLSNGLTLNNNAYDGFDNDLDGLIDENYQVHFRQYKETHEGVVLVDTLNPVKYMDFVSGRGLENPLIDEARDDGVDNDGDWDLLKDDVGADGKPGTGDLGEGDGRPTDGEPNFDSKDVDESDQLGLTSFDYFVPSTDIDMSNETEMWRRLSPGRFDVPESVVGNRAVRGEDGDFIFGSGFFPLMPGKTERFSLALVFGEDYEGVVRSKNIAGLIYDANYNFPRPPDMPTLTAVPGDGKVTLYWDRIAESSFDKSLQKYDFEGYKIYRGTDPSFSDAKTISNGYGDLVDYKPIAQFDLDNNNAGFFHADELLHELSSATPFYLGDDSGLRNSYVDDDVTNGRTYYYAVCAYDHGDEFESIFPSENTKTIYVDASGQTILSKNTAMVAPNRPVADYVAPESGVELTRLDGQSTFTPFAEVVDPGQMRDAAYYVSFSGQEIAGVDVAYAYTVVDSATGDTMLNKNTAMYPSDCDVFHGVRFSFNTKYQEPDSVRADTLNTSWNRTGDDNLKPIISMFNWKEFVSVRCPYDYLFVFKNENSSTSSRLEKIFGRTSPLKEVATNFDVYDVTIPDHPVPVPYGFVESAGSAKGELSHFDAVYLATSDSSRLSWKVVFSGQDKHAPAAGDSLAISFFKPFTSRDIFVYRSKAAFTDAAIGKENLDNIRVVPNPYVVTNVFEQPLPSQMSGRGARVINFINVPSQSTVRIFSSDGNLVRTLHHDGDLENGSISWDLRSREGMDVACGVYFYIVEAEHISGSKTGKIAIIK